MISIDDSKKILLANHSTPTMFYSEYATPNKYRFTIVDDKCYYKLQFPILEKIAIGCRTQLNFTVHFRKYFFSKQSFQQVDPVFYF